MEKVSTLETKQDVTEQKVYDMQCQIAWLEQYGMKNDIIISGIEEDEDECNKNNSKITKNSATKNVAIKLAKRLGVEINDSDIVIAHRLAVRTSNNDERRKIPNIIVRFVQEEKKQQVIAASKEKKPKNGEQRNIYCNEHLSSYTWEMLNAARQYRDDGEIKYVWIQDGKVLVREEERSKAIRIWSCQHLDYIIKEKRSRNRE